MARLMSFPFELNTIAASMDWQTSTTGTPVIETTDFRSGAAALRINSAAGAENIQHIFRTTQGPCWTRFYFKVVAGATGNDVTIIATLNGATARVGVLINADETLEFWNLEDSAQVGASSSAISLDTWYRLEYLIDSTTLASTAIEARLYAASDESTLLWNPSGTINLALNPDRFRLGIPSADATLDIIYEDGAINDNSGSFENSWPGEGEQIMLRPSAAGDNADWTRGGTDSGANWSQEEEAPPDDVTTYVQSNTSGQIDDYNLDATPAAMASDDVINCVQVGVRFAISGAGGADPDFVLRIKASSGGTVEESAALSGAGDTSYQSYKIATPRQYALTLYDLPGGSATAWTKADLDAAQVGIRETITDTHFVRVSALWVVVDHKPAAAGGQTIPVGQATEADTAQAITLLRTYPITQVTETDLAQAISAVRAYAVGQASETDLAQAVVVLRTYLIGQAFETDLAQDIGQPAKVNQVLETDLAQAITVVKALLLGQATEADLAQAIAVLKSLTVGQVQETDLAQAIAVLKSLTVGQVQEADLAQAITVVRSRLLGQASETDVAQAITVLKAALIGQASETDLARAITILRTVLVAQVQETDLAQAITALLGRVVQQVQETDLAQAITVVAGAAPIPPPAPPAPPMVVVGRVRRRREEPSAPIRRLIDELFEPARQAELRRIEELLREDDEEIPPPASRPSPKGLGEVGLEDLIRASKGYENLVADIAVAVTKAINLPGLKEYLKVQDARVAAIEKGPTAPDRGPSVDALAPDRGPSVDALAPAEAARLYQEMVGEMMGLIDLDVPPPTMTAERRKEILSKPGIHATQVAILKQTRARPLRTKYEKRLAALIRQLATGELNAAEFMDSAFQATVDAYWDAFGDGRDAGGVEEAVEVYFHEGGIVAAQVVWAGQSLQKIIALLPAGHSDGDLQEALRRVPTMASAIEVLWYEGLGTAADDPLYEWIIGSTKEHCTDCLGYHGQRHRLKAWIAAGAIPQSYPLECHGFECKCELRKSRGHEVGTLRSPGLN